MKHIENKTSYKTILIPSLIIYNGSYYKLGTVQDFHSRWINIDTGEEIKRTRDFHGDEYVMFSEAYILGREAEYKNKADRGNVRSFVKSTEVVIDKEMGGSKTNPFYDIIVTMENGDTLSIYSIEFLTEVENYTKSAYDVLNEILRDLM